MTRIMRRSSKVLDGTTMEITMTVIRQIVVVMTSNRFILGECGYPQNCGSRCRTIEHTVTNKHGQLQTEMTWLYVDTHSLLSRGIRDEGLTQWTTFKSTCSLIRRRGLGINWINIVFLHV